MEYSTLIEAEIVQDFEHRVVRAGDKAPLLRALGAYAGNETSAANSVTGPQETPTAPM